MLRYESEMNSSSPSHIHDIIILGILIFCIGIHQVVDEISESDASQNRISQHIDKDQKYFCLHSTKAGGLYTLGLSRFRVEFTLE